MRWLYRLLHWAFLGRALARGPGSFARSEARRQVRRLLAGRRPRL
jgi:hypothetical protein